MAKSEATEQLERDIWLATNKLGVFCCYEVTIGIGGNERVDFMTLDTKGIWRCYEIKCSLSDFRSKAAKSFYGHYNYYVLTAELYEKVKDEIPKHIGVYVGRRLVKNARKQELVIEDDVLKLSFIRSLSRDAAKLVRSENPKVIERYEQRIRNFEEDNRVLRNNKIDLGNKLYKKFGRGWQDLLDDETA